MSRTMPTECEHGKVMDWGDFGDEWDPYKNTCRVCTPARLALELTVWYRLNNRDWLEEFHKRWYEQYDMANKSEATRPATEVA